MIAQTLPPKEIPAAHIRTSGNWMTPAEEVAPAYPGFLSQGMPASASERVRRSIL